MEVEVLKKNIVVALNNGEIGKAIDIIIEFLSMNKFYEERDQMIIVKSKWVNTEKDFRVVGSISRSEYEVLSGKVIQAILNILQSTAGEINFEIESLKPKVFVKSRKKSISRIVGIFVIVCGIISSVFYFNTAAIKHQGSIEKDSLPVRDSGKLKYSKLHVVSKEKKDNPRQRIINTDPVLTSNRIGLYVNNLVLLQALSNVLEKEGKKIIPTDRQQLQKFEKYILANLSVKARKKKYSVLLFIFMMLI